MFAFKLWASVALFAGMSLAEIQNYQRWLMIIKTKAEAGDVYNGQLNQADIDAARAAFMETWPRTISDITNGAVHIEPHVEVSDIPLKQVDRDSATGMVHPEYMQEDVDKWVDPKKYDGVAVYNAFTEGKYWGTSSAAGVGWFSVPKVDDLAYNSWTMAGWTHECLHTQGWYFDDSRLGPVAPKCQSSNDGRDGVHCAGDLGYQAGQDNMVDFMAFYRDFWNGQVTGTNGLGQKAWDLGSRVEAARGVAPKSTIPKDIPQQSKGPVSTKSMDLKSMTETQPFCSNTKKTSRSFMA